MTSELDSGDESPTELRRQRDFRIRSLLAVGGFLLATLALHLWAHLGGTSPWRFGWALLPLAPLVWLVVVIVLRVRQMDEYQVRLFFPGLAVGFTVAMVTALTVGTLSSAGLPMPNAGWAIGVAGLLAWQVTNIVTGAPQR